MNINAMSYNSVSFHTRNVNNISSPSAKPTTELQVEKAGSDIVHVNKDSFYKASQKSELTSYSKDIAQGSREQRISELKVKYQGDACPVSSSDIADAMVRNICGYN